MISAGAVEKLFEEGFFTSLTALKLLDDADLSKVKILRGQKKLILSCVPTYCRRDHHATAGSREGVHPNKPNGGSVHATSEKREKYS